MTTLARARRSEIDWLDHMRRAFADARFSDAAIEYDDHKANAPWAATLLRARIHFKALEYPDAIALLSSPPKRLEKSLEAERLMLLGVAHSRTNQFDNADEFFTRAEHAGAAKLFPVEFPYLLGRRFLEARQPKRARTQLAKVRLFRADDARIFADLLESGTLSEEEHYRDEAQLLVGLIRFIDSCGRAYIEERAHALGMLAMLARELDEPDIRTFLSAHVGRQVWTDELRVQQFQTLKAVGWCHALQGDYFNGLRHLKMAGKIAPSEAWRAMTLLDRAYLARCFGESRWSRDELADADDLLTAVRWRETRDEERVALILAAELFAPVDSGKAASYLARFSELRDAMSPLILSRYDRRLGALADYATGIVDIHFGNRQAATATLRRAWKTYDEIRYDWRAGRVALRLYELTKDNQWLMRAQDKLKNYRASWLWGEVQGGQPGLEDLPRLTRAQRRVLQMLYEGKTTKQICEETGRSVFTIQNHIKAVLKAFKLPNRTTLVAELVKRGITQL